MGGRRDPLFRLPSPDSPLCMTMARWLMFSFVKLHSECFATRTLHKSDVWVLRFTPIRLLAIIDGWSHGSLMDYSARTFQQEQVPSMVIRPTTLEYLCVGRGRPEYTDRSPPFKINLANSPVGIKSSYGWIRLWFTGLLGLFGCF